MFISLRLREIVFRWMVHEDDRCTGMCIGTCADVTDNVCTEQEGGGRGGEDNFTRECTRDVRRAPFVTCFGRFKWTSFEERMMYSDKHRLLPRILEFPMERAYVSRRRRVCLPPENRARLVLRSECTTPRGICSPCFKPTVRKAAKIRALERNIPRRLWSPTGRTFPYAMISLRRSG